MNLPKAGNGSTGLTVVPIIILPKAANGIPKGFSHMPSIVKDKERLPVTPTPMLAEKINKRLNLSYGEHEIFGKKMAC